ncbi:hypothetical protein RAS12_08215 [Achromobacter seleniivolatilans]|uniref:DUF35 domain-containing protein n=1 Tax=Achromobacter seleniivolatilans TaxID=3047478 RepID=A0ABY9M5T4_9BURK|nr:hypothetical protein [Achromobacter sp. R39]WMD22351.1 hypothetical protein RAS12_08215 [Achromobacter sp. R39]
MSVNVHQCRACGHCVYPARLWCPVCGHDKNQPASVDYAELVAWTVMPQKEGDMAPVVIATVRGVPDGPVMVVRLEEMPARVGQRLRLFEREMQGRKLPWAWTVAE